MIIHEWTQIVIRTIDNHSSLLCNILEIRQASKVHGRDEYVLFGVHGFQLAVLKTLYPLRFQWRILASSLVLRPPGHWYMYVIKYI